MFFESIGYDGAMRLKNFLILFAGISIGSIVMQHVTLKFFKEVERDKRVGKAALVRVGGQLKANSITMSDYYESFWVWVVAKLTRPKAITFRSERLARSLMVFFAIMVTLSILMGGALLFQVVTIDEFLDK